MYIYVDDGDRIVTMMMRMMMGIVMRRRAFEKKALYDHVCLYGCTYVYVCLSMAMNGIGIVMMMKRMVMGLL